MLHGRLFVKVGQVEHMNAWTTTEPLHSIPDRTLFQPCEKGTRWEQEGLYAWFEGCYEVPVSLSGQDLFILPRIKAYEGLLWVNGKYRYDFELHLHTDESRVKDVIVEIKIVQKNL